MKHTKGRPPQGACEVERWNGRRWIPDDGKPGTAFSFQDSKGFPIAMACDCCCSISDETCPYVRAMNRTVERWACTNGRSFKT